METIWSDRIDAILSKGLPLRCLGINNWALERESALAAINVIVELGHAILGGDVFQLNECGVLVSRDSWFCEPHDGENDKAFVMRSSKKAKTFIELYPRAEKSALFAIVPLVKSNS